MFRSFEQSDSLVATPKNVKREGDSYRDPRLKWFRIRPILLNKVPELSTLERDFRAVSSVPK